MGSNQQERINWNSMSTESLKARRSEREKNVEYPGIGDLGRIAQVLLQLADDDRDFPSQSGQVHPAFIRDTAQRKAQRDLTDRLLKGLVRAMNAILNSTEGQIVEWWWGGGGYM